MTFPQKQIRRVQQPVIGFADDLQSAQVAQRFERCGHADFRMLLAIQQLQILHGVFNVDDASGAVLHIDSAGLHELLHLPLPQVKRILPVPGLAAIRKAVAMRLHAAAQILVSGTPSQFDQRLTFKRRRVPVDAVVLRELFKRSGPGPASP